MPQKRVICPMGGKCGSNEHDPNSNRYKLCLNKSIRSRTGRSGASFGAPALTKTQEQYNSAYKALEDYHAATAANPEPDWLMSIKAQRSDGSLVYTTVTRKTPVSAPTFAPGVRIISDADWDFERTDWITEHLGTDIYHELCDELDVDPDPEDDEIVIDVADPIDLKAVESVLEQWGMSLVTIEHTSADSGASERYIGISGGDGTNVIPKERLESAAAKYARWEHDEGWSAYSEILYPDGSTSHIVGTCTMDALKPELAVDRAGGGEIVSFHTKYA